MAGVGQVKATPGPKMDFPSAQAVPSPPTHVYAVGRLPSLPTSLPPSAATADLFTSGAVIN